VPAFPKSYADQVARLRVPSGFVLVAAFAWFARPSPISLAWGVPVSLAGLLLRGWAAGCLDKNRLLATTGPYAHTRNPLYLGTALVAAGLVIASRQAALAVLCAAVFYLIYLPVIQLEEQHLRKLFPEYDDYARQIPALWPHFRANLEHVRGNPFAWRFYSQNREYEAAAAYAAGLALLVWKALDR
jgi:protein-S-isoprenylcysteine O-methyltransferase Ste14